jgi:hypothetical protein
MKFNKYKLRDGDTREVVPGTYYDTLLSNDGGVILLGTIDLPIEVEKKEVERVKKVDSLDFITGIPSDAYDIEVHFKVKE